MKNSFAMYKCWEKKKYLLGDYAAEWLRPVYESPAIPLLLQKSVAKWMLAKFLASQMACVF